MLKLYKDYRLGGEARYLLCNKGEKPMMVPDETRKCVAFVGCKNNDEKIRFGGTCFFASIPLGIDNFNFNYCITAKHVIEMIKKNSIDQKVYLRFNTKDGGIQIIPTPIENWLSHPNDLAVDVAALFSPMPYPEMDYKRIPYSMMASEKIIKSEGIGIGDEVFIAGLFANHFGEKKNLPILRIGNIAMMPEEKIFSQELGLIDAYLIEARSIGGLSGSPVFAHLAGVRYQDGESHIIPGRFFFIGLIHGHWDVPIDKQDDIFIEDFLKNERINMGIAIVIPTYKILEVLNQNTFLQKREEIKKKIQEKKSPTLDS